MSWLVAGEQRADDGLGPRRQREHRMRHQPALHQRPHGLDLDRIACLQVRLDEPRRPTRSLLSRHERRVGEAFAQGCDIGLGQDI